MEDEAKSGEVLTEQCTNGVLIKPKTLTETYAARVDVSLQGLLVPACMPHGALVIPVLNEWHKIKDPDVLGHLDLLGEPAQTPRDPCRSKGVRINKKILTTQGARI